MRITQKLICILILIFFITTPVYAAEGTQSATPNADIKFKLKALQDEIASKAARFKAEISQKLQNRAYIGSVKEKNESVIMIDSQENKYTVTVTLDTVFSGKFKKISSDWKTNLANLAIGDFIVALGDVDTNENLTAKKIIKLSASPFLKKVVVMGKITSLAGGKITIINKEKEIYIFNTNPKTSYQIGKSAGLFKDIKSEMSVIIVGVDPQENIYKARSVYVITSPNLSQIKSTTQSAF